MGIKINTLPFIPIEEVIETIETTTVTNDDIKKLENSINNLYKIIELKTKRNHGRQGQRRG